MIYECSLMLGKKNAHIAVFSADKDVIVIVIAQRGL